MKSLRKIKSPAALAAFGAFFVPEPLGACVVFAAAIWWSWRKLSRNQSRSGFAPTLPSTDGKEAIASAATAPLGA
jgi:hypothetical protein